MNNLSSGYRVFTSYWWKYWFSPSSYYYWAKYKIQRANRGWADCDVGSLDYYLSQWLPDALKLLRSTKHGTPFSMFEPGECETIQSDGTQWAGEEASARAEAKWQVTLTKMIEGFEALNRMDDGLYESELGPYPMSIHFLEDINNPSEEREQRYKKSRGLEKRDEAIFQEGMKLFVEHFRDLWD